MDKLKEVGRMNPSAPPVSSVELVFNVFLDSPQHAFEMIAPGSINLQYKKGKNINCPDWPGLFQLPESLENVQS